MYDLKGSNVFSYFYTNEVKEPVNFVDFNSQNNLLLSITGQRNFINNVNDDISEESIKEEDEEDKLTCKESKLRLWDFKLN